MSTSSILAWLDTIPITNPAPNHEHAGPAKRRRFNPPTPDPSISPTMSISVTGKREGPTAGEVSPSKRSRKIRSEVDLEQPSEASVASGRLSPTKQLQYLRLQPGGPDYKEFALFTNKPKSLRTLLARIDHIKDGFGIISSSQKEDVLAAPKHCYDEFDWVETGTHCFSDERDTLGPTPSVQFVFDILDKAAACNNQHHHEDAWNKSVHAPILEFAFHKKDQRLKNQLISSSSCIHASILPEYQTGTPGTAKKVDFVIHLNPANDPTPEPTLAIERLIGQLPGMVFNHTNFQPLYDRPIALSIETKRPTEGIVVAKLQLGVWQTAHWAFLRTLIQTKEENKEKHKRLQEAKRLQEEAQTQALEGTLDSGVQTPAELLPLRERQSDVEVSEPETPGVQESGVEPLDVQKVSTKKFKLPEFLPGVIVNGHDWYFTVTTFDGLRVKFYEKVLLGSTNGTKEIYKLICNLQILRQWIDGTYWPWLRDLVLDC
ncbi:hypothetical protein BFJ63_vAg19065 [Fusarium oxysporum f. sp. narcissi]|uniref:PD-(D/E)XK nuclease-like domain-containing protein n=1 Tax=Fusarium oxysporum f. sp. narcissi TaxID=451672 RepID=A0A4Q2UUV4_FUSOX|nr:hypothetical protein BFJ63_vAg19065 [Fusarium oxysporum f. sp. narcissi]